MRQHHSFIIREDATDQLEEDNRAIILYDFLGIAMMHQCRQQHNTAQCQLAIVIVMQRINHRFNAITRHQFATCCLVLIIQFEMVLIICKLSTFLTSS